LKIGQSAGNQIAQRYLLQIYKKAEKEMFDILFELTSNLQIERSFSIKN